MAENADGSERFGNYRAVKALQAACPVSLAQLKEPGIKGCVLRPQKYLRSRGALPSVLPNKSMRIAVFLALSLTSASELPRIRPDATSLLSTDHWWAQVGDHVVHSPHADSGLSSNVGDYYYAYGSHGALNAELREKRVGGSGRVHIFHLPEGKDSLVTNLPKKAGRRDSLSSLVQLNHKDVLSDAKLFPDFELPKDYESGLSTSGTQLEKKVVDSISSSSLMQQLKDLVQLGDGTDQTRSYTNPKATANTVQYLQKKFKDLGYQTCTEKFSDQTDVVAFLPGSESGTVTVGGHYDSRPFEGSAPGAVDNGSGASAVLEIARAVANAGEALSWDDRECDLWFYTDGEFHPREAPAGNWSHFGARDSHPGRISVVTVTTGEAWTAAKDRHRFHELLFWNFHCQAWDDKELIVVETYEDEPSSFLSGKAAWTSNMKVISLQRLPGDDLNIGIHAASGDMIAHFDDDDLYAPGYLAFMSTRLATLAESPRVGAFGYCDAARLGRRRHMSRKTPEVKIGLYSFGFTLLYHRQVALQLPFGDRNLGEDYDWCEKFGQLSLALMPDEFGVCLHVQHGDNVSDIDPFVYTDVSLKEIRTLKVVNNWPRPRLRVPFLTLQDFRDRPPGPPGPLCYISVMWDDGDGDLRSRRASRPLSNSLNWWPELKKRGKEAFYHLNSPKKLEMLASLATRMQASEVRLPKASMTRMNPYAASLVQNELFLFPRPLCGSGRKMWMLHGLHFVKPKKTLVFACFAAEEPGLRGSKEFASRLASDSTSSGSSLAEDNDKTAAKLMSRMCGTADGAAILQDNSFMRRKRQRRAAEEHEALVMDEIAWRSPSTDGPVVNLESYDWADKVLKHLAGASKTHNGDKLKVTHSNNPFGSDHMSFLEQKIQSVLSIHGDDESYPHYHQPTDAIDQVNPELYTLITKMNAGAALRLAGVA
eukprot:s278_g4.t2